jgi:hypothetical protein
VSGRDSCANMSLLPTTRNSLRAILRRIYPPVNMCQLPSLLLLQAKLPAHTTREKTARLRAETQHIRRQTNGGQRPSIPLPDPLDRERMLIILEAIHIPISPKPTTTALPPRCHTPRLHPLLSTAAFRATPRIPCILLIGQHSPRRPASHSKAAIEC